MVALTELAQPKQAVAECAAFKEPPPTVLPLMQAAALACQKPDLAEAEWKRISGDWLKKGQCRQFVPELQRVQTLDAEAKAAIRNHLAKWLAADAAGDNYAEKKSVEEVWSVGQMEKISALCGAVADWLFGLLKTE